MIHFVYLIILFYTNKQDHLQVAVPTVSVSLSTCTCGKVWRYTSRPSVMRYLGDRWHHSLHSLPGLNNVPLLIALEPVHGDTALRLGRQESSSAW